MGKKQIIMPDQDAAYLRANHKTQSVPQMAKALKRTGKTVYGFMKELGLTPKGRVIDQTHPWERKNRLLRAVLIDQRQANTKAKAQK